MASIDYIARLLNTHGVNLAAVGGGGERPDQLLVYGALGLGNLSDRALAIGLAVYAPNPFHDQNVEAERHIVELINQYGSRYKWDFNVPKKQQWSSTELTPELLKRNLASLALFELKQDGKCISCHGSGTKPGTYRVCRKCKGEGRRPLTEIFKYDWICISRQAWRTWQYRYNRIYMGVQAWKEEFDDHIIRHFE